MAAALAALLACAALAAEDPKPQEPTPAEPPRLTEELTVTAAREPTRIADTPASVAILPREGLLVTAAPFVDDALRQVVGFSLFRRTGSRTANPTSQGVSLRGLGASGASRALVLADGLPLNDPFGGWVYWARAPRLDVERLEVLRGGAADLYGSGALGGVIQVFSRDARQGGGVEAELSGGGDQTFEGALSAHAARGAWAGRLSGEAYHTDGYIPVDEASRGAVDSEAASEHVALDARVERTAWGDGRVFLRGQYYDEDRKNGTPLQTNDTRIGLGALGVDFGSAEHGRTTIRAWGSSQLYHQSFSAIATDRSREDLTRLQRVPADALGVSAQWTRPLRLATPSAARRGGPPRLRHDRGAGDHARRGDERGRGGRRRGGRRSLRAGPDPAPPAPRRDGVAALRRVVAARWPSDDDAGRDRHHDHHGASRPRGDPREPAPGPGVPRAAGPVAHGVRLRCVPRADAQRALPLVPPRRHAHAREPGARARAAPGAGKWARSRRTGGGRSG